VDATPEIRAEPVDFFSRTFRRALDLIVRGMVPLVCVALMMGVAKVFLNLWAVWQSPSIASGFDILVTDVLSMFVVIELLKSIIEYFHAHRIRITFIIDAATVFVLREIMIELFAHQLGAGQTAALSALLLVLGILRAFAIRHSPEGPGPEARHA
jgi:uncharacterized membrane protein (DUF373 family)